MPVIEGVEPVRLLPDRLAVAGFSLPVMGIILGESADQELSRDNFNWLGAYMIEQVGLHEMELAEWFTSEGGELDGERPLDVWGELGGFGRVFDYAKAYKELCDDALADAAPEDTDSLRRSLSIGHSAIDMIERAFALSGVSLELKQDESGPWGNAMLWNPEKPEAARAHWRKKGNSDTYMISFSEGETERRYITGRMTEPGGRAIVIQSAILEITGGERVPTEYDSALDGRPPSAGQVAEFVIPLASEAKSRSLVAYA
jgi:hypothetical protein